MQASAKEASSLPADKMPLNGTDALASSEIRKPSSSASPLVQDIAGCRDKVEVLPEPNYATGNVCQIPFDVVGSHKTGSFIYYTEDGELDRGEYHNVTIQQTQPEPGVFLVEYEFPELNYSGSTRFNVNDNTLQSSSFEPETIEIDSIECTKMGEGFYSGVRTFQATAGGEAYDVRESMVVMDGAQHFVQSTRPAETDEAFVPAGVHFATKNQ